MYVITNNIRFDPSQLCIIEEVPFEMIPPAQLKHRLFKNYAVISETEVNIYGEVDERHRHGMEWNTSHFNNVYIPYSILLYFSQCHSDIAHPNI